MGVVGRLDQYASTLAWEFDETTANNPSITGLGTYYASEFSENVGIATTMTANIFPPYDPVYDEFGGTLFGAGQGRYMRQNTDKSVIVYNEIDEIGLNPSYRIFSSATSVNEGSSVIFTANSTNVESGTTLYYNITGSVGIASTDFTNNSLSGSLVISGTFDSGFGSTTLTLVNDILTEGIETFNMNLRTGSISGPIVTTSPTVTILDTSVPTVTPTTTNLDEGSSVTFNVTSNQLSTTLYWTLNPISGSITTSDFVGVATTGSFATNGAGVGSTTLTLANDSSTEGTESFQLQVRTGSTSGSIIATSATVIVLDTSIQTLTPGLAGKFFNGSWRSTIATGNIGTLPLTTANDSSNVTGTTGLPSAAHRFGVNLWTSIAYGDGLGENYGFIAIGYFTPPTTGTYTIFTSSDDGSGVWIGDLALEGATRTSANATLNNGLGLGQGNTKRSGTIALTGGVRYPIRIVYEEGAGGDNLTFSWSGPSITETTSLSTYFSTPTLGGVLTGNY